MAQEIFPVFAEALTGNTIAEDGLPMLRECKWDFVQDCPVFDQGKPITVTGHDAVLVWVWNALHTVRGRYEIYTENYGSDVENLIGTGWSSELKAAEARQYVEECLLAFPYIRAVRNLTVAFCGNELTISCRIESIYGESRWEETQHGLAIS